MNSTNYSQKIRTLMRALFIIVIASILVVVNGRPGFAAGLETRLVLIGSSIPSAQTNHAFSFDLVSGGSLGSIEFEYCSNNPFVGTFCTAPAGLDLTPAVLTGESGEIGFNVDPGSSTANKLVITRPSLPASPQTSTYTFDSVINPSTPKQTVYVRISTFSSINATGPRTDTGSVAFSTSGLFSVGGYVPPYLIFCSGVTVTQGCGSTGANFIDLGELSKTSPKAATSQFTGATNDPTGFVTTMFGTTLTSGNQVIDALSTPTTSSAGTSQFGVNMRANNSPNIGQDPAGPGTSTLSADYNIPNKFVLKNGVVTSSALSTEYRIFTVSYVVNISPAQPPGVYNTSMTYVATASF